MIEIKSPMEAVILEVGDSAISKKPMILFEIERVKIRLIVSKKEATAAAAHLYETIPLTMIFEIPDPKPEP
jgi:hypothetical protein